MPYVTIEGCRSFYGESLPNKGEPKHTIVLVHGAGGNHKHWLHQLDYLGRKHRVLAVDLPGHGLSQGKPCDLIEGYCEFIREFAAAVLDGPFYLGGHSMGGAITIQFGSRYPEMLKGMILVGTGARLRVLDSILNTFNSGQHFTNLIPMLYGKNVLRETIRAAGEELVAVSPVTWFTDFTACNRFDLIAALGGIHVPALVVSATGDQMTPVKYGQYLASSLPNAKMVVIVGAGHMIMLEKPGELNEAVENFVDAL